MGARFVKLGIAGFKSFADATSLEILPGLTGVVGPNGCGKSNVAEALRWAMGEANVRHLRGGEMDDVIFAGTAHRPSRNLAEVSVHIEADDTGLPPPFSSHAELQVVRRIERGGGSAYRVNGREARARDVQTLFADLASGARASAMVSQGRVGALVNARPEERRAVLEEAAGITGLHTRRAEAETRLRAAEANLERAEDRRTQLEQQLDGLRVQARQAARYRTVTVGVLEAEAALLAVQRSRAERARTEADTALRQAAGAVQAAARLAAAAAADSARAQAALPGLRESEAEARASLDRARQAQETLAAEAARTQAAAEAARLRHQQIARDLDHAQALLLEAEGTDSRLLAEADRLHAECLTHPAALEAARTAAEAAAADLVHADHAATEAAARAAQAQARASATRQVLDQAEARARRARDAAARLDAERASVAAQAVAPSLRQAAHDALAAAERALHDARAAQDRAEAGRAPAAEAATAARDTHARADTARQKLHAEAAGLAEALGVKDGERWPPMVDRLTVPPGLEAALGAALGEELAAAEDPAAARHWRTPGTDAVPPPPGRPLGVAGPAVLDRALSAIGLVETEAEGEAAHARLLPGQCLVSTSGALWRWDGYTIRAGTPTAAAVRLKQRNRLAGLRTRLEAATRETKEAANERATADRAEQTAQTTEQQTRQACRATETARERARTAFRDMDARAEAAESRLATLDEQRLRHAPELEAATRAHAESRQAHEARPDPAALRTAADQARAAVALARTRDAAATRIWEAEQRTEQARQARLGTIDREREDRRMRATDLAARMTDLEVRAAEAAAELARTAEAPAVLARQTEQARTAQAEAGTVHRAAAQARETAERALETLTTAARTAEHAVFAVREAEVRAQAGLETAELAWVVALARVDERQGALPPVPTTAESSIVAEDRARQRLQRLMRERDEIGPVNLRAETEAGIIEAAAAAIVHDREELGTAIAKLRGSIGHLNREGRERLSAVFQQVDRHFQALFARMFGGGRAHLALVGSDDPLQAGLEIFAQPPGKKLAALSLLSGGEQALTALSLIFGVFRCNPAPLCVLDEVDAPLDDANVERFCALLADMVHETGTRFLVVTHHQLTMSRMDRLYGVTMQERGVSRVLSVDLSHASTMVGAVAAE